MSRTRGLWQAGGGSGSRCSRTGSLPLFQVEDQRRRLRGVGPGLDLPRLHPIPTSLFLLRRPSARRPLSLTLAPAQAHPSSAAMNYNHSHRVYIKASVRPSPPASPRSGVRSTLILFSPSALRLSPLPVAVVSQHVQASNPEHPVVQHEHHPQRVLARRGRHPGQVRCCKVSPSSWPRRSLEGPVSRRSGDRAGCEELLGSGRRSDGGRGEVTTDVLALSQGLLVGPRERQQERTTVRAGLSPITTTSLFSVDFGKTTFRREFLLSQLRSGPGCPTSSLWSRSVGEWSLARALPAWTGPSRLLRLPSCSAPLAPPFPLARLVSASWSSVHLLLSA